MRLYTSVATGSRVKKTGFFIFNGIKNKEKSIFYTKYNCWSLGKEEKQNTQKKNFYKPTKLGGTPWDFSFLKIISIIIILITKQVTTISNHLNHLDAMFDFRDRFNENSLKNRVA